MRELDLAQIRYLRLRAQNLVPGISEEPLTPVALLNRLCGFQAQDLPAANLAFRPRSNDLTLADVQEARLRTGSIVRTWAMRGTLHILAAADLGWLLPLFGPLFVRKSRRRYQQIGLDETFCEKAIAALPAVLSGRGSLTRSQLAEELSQRGFPTTGQATYHLLRRAALEGVICYGPDSEGHPAFVLLDEWVPADGKAVDRQTALARLARRYLAAYGPAAAEDLANWSGLSIKESRSGVAQIMADLHELGSAGKTYWLLKDQAAWLDDPPSGLVVNLLPGFDTYLLGYRSRALTVPAAYARRVHPGGGMLRRTLLVDGLAAGTWNLKRNKSGVAVRVAPFEGLNAEVMEVLAEEVRDLGRFQQEEAVLHLDTPAAPG